MPLLASPPMALANLHLTGMLVNLALVMPRLSHPRKSLLIIYLFIYIYLPFMLRQLPVWIVAALAVAFLPLCVV